MLGRFRRRRALGRALLALLAIAAAIALVAGAALFWLRGQGRARRDGTVRLPALAAPVEVRWDAWGVPHVRAESDRDLAAALGYLHANDRMTQMELSRRSAAGRLSEIFGAISVEGDVLARRMRYRRSAEDLLGTAAPESRGWLEAYAAGVNVWLEERADDLPPTLTLFGVEPEPWTPVDSLSVAMLMARELSFWQGRPEELRFDWLRSLGPERTADLLGPSGEVPLHVPEAIVELARKLSPALPPALPESGPDPAPGSNNWAVGASRSEEGAPLVASDPHLGLRLPGVWYQVHLRSPGYAAAGMTFAGMPGVVIGRGESVAWALTNLMLDDHDLFFEETAADGRRVRRGDGWAPVAVERESVRVRGGDPVEVEVATTDRGPLLPADPERGLPPRSIAWTAYHPGDPLAAFLALARAETVDEIVAVIGGYVCPAQNLVAADRHGGLLYAALGRLPARRRGDGRLPAPARDPSYGWDGLVPVDDNPRILRPAADLLVTANNDTRPEGYALPLTGDFDLESRAERIRQLLEGRPRWERKGLGRVQTDVVSPYALAVVRGAAGNYPGDAGMAWAALTAWDGSMERRGPAALFALFERRLTEAVFGDELDLERASGMSRRSWLERILAGGMSPVWFDDVATPEVEERAAIVERALADAWRAGAERWGPDVGRWAYGDLHRLRLRHPLGLLPLFGRLVDRGPFPLPGSATTVTAFGGPWRGDELPVTYGPSMRWVTAAGAGDGTLAVLPGGQAGHPFDPHYDDQLELYLEGRLREVAWSEEAIRDATVSTLRLEPR